jgi:protease I
MTKGTIAVLVGPEYEDLEVWYPKLRLEAAGYAAPLVGIGAKSYVGKHGYPCTVDFNTGDIKHDTLAGIVAPGGWAPDKIRRAPEVLQLIQEVHREGGLIATICHGPWILISAGVARGRRMTGSAGVRDDLTNAGAIWVDEAVVQDGNVISSRVPKDLPAFGEAIVGWLDARQRRVRPS